MTSDARRLLNHYVATLAYRGRNVLGGLPAGLGTFRPDDSVRDLTTILAHVNDVLAFAQRQFGAEPDQRPAAPDWDSELTRYFDNLNALDRLFRSGELSGPINELQLLQGPLADAMLHLGQIGIFRRMAGSPVTGEDYSIAELPPPPWSP